MALPELKFSPDQKSTIRKEWFSRIGFSIPENSILLGLYNGQSMHMDSDSLNIGFFHRFPLNIGFYNNKCTKN